MLFNTFGFIFVFLPVTLLSFFMLARISYAFAAGWLALASIFFYGYWNPTYVGLLLGSIAFNYLMGVGIAKAEDKKKKRLLRSEKLLRKFAHRRKRKRRAASEFVVIEKWHSFWQ